MAATVCDHDDAALTSAILQPQSEAECAALVERLAECDACRQRFTEYQTMVTGLRQLVPARALSLAPARDESAPVGAPAHPTLGWWRERRPADAPAAALRRATSRPDIDGRWSFTLVGTLAALLLLALLLASLWSFGPERGMGGVPAQHARTSVGQVVVDPPLDTSPLACAGAPVPQPVVQGIGHAIGAAPFWVGGFVGTHATLLAGGTSPSPYGWYGKIVTHVDAGFNGTVTVRGTNLRNNTPLWFQLAGRTTRTPVYQHGAGASDAGYIFIPTAGCYTLTVTWAAGSWTSTFGAGRTLPTSVGAMPASCPSQPAPAPLAASLPGVIGALPLWMTADGPYASYRLDLSGDGVPVTFFVSNTFTHTVSLQGRSVANGAPVGFVAPPNPPATVLALNNSYVRSSGPFTEWQSRAYFPAAGCYALTATWPGGSWTFDVAAGS